MKNYLDLADLDGAEIRALLDLARDLEANPTSDALAGKVLALLFFNPSVRTLASMQAGMSQLGGSSFVIAPGQGSWGFELETGVVMHGVAAEHVREAIPVLEEYADALAVRCFPKGEDLAEDLAEPVLGTLADLGKKPLINLESAAAHPCQALGDWKTLDDIGVPDDGHLVLSWASHPKALPLSVPASTVHMAARRGMHVTVLRPDGFGLPDAVMRKAREAADLSGGRVDETDDVAAAMEGAHVLYAKSWQAPAHYGDASAEAELRARHTDWCVDEPWFASAQPDATFMHCLPVRRNVVVSDAVLDGSRSRVVPQAGNRLHVQKAILMELLGKENRS